MPEPLKAVPEDSLDEAPLYLPPEDAALERALRRAKGSSRHSADLDWQCVVCGLWHGKTETRCECGFEPDGDFGWPARGAEVHRSND